jgi:hypothetical protein
MVRFGCCQVFAMVKNVQKQFEFFLKILGVVRDLFPVDRYVHWLSLFKSSF